MWPFLAGARREQPDDPPSFGASTGKRGQPGGKRHFTPDDLRRWFLSALMELGCPPEVRHDLVGHKKSKRDAAYERPTPLDDARLWVEKIDEILKGS